MGSLSAIHNCFPSEVIPDNGYFSMGIHPWLLREDSMVDELETMLSVIHHTRLLMIGECGIDKTKGPDLNVQLTAFQRQIDLSQIASKPLVVHCVRAFDELIRLKKSHLSQQWALHAFHGSPQMAIQLCRMGFYLSVGLRQMEGDSGMVRLRGIPADRLLLETDDDPHPIGEVFGKAAAILGMSIEALEARVVVNVQTFLGRSLF
ncbi:TatD family hydrolase [Breznakibacter xylanolyticus]|uniref:TatD family hydrolase n=1 Tax=Breznakibacter xylanolyticus TaxID=990 RepID=UPI001475326E|nr:TatD family hydrolase [Breznakibacter xylanolyticus]MBN2742910.1 TatD family hydrolase [Marinilabiliaceae bacterium]